MQTRPHLTVPLKLLETENDTIYQASVNALAVITSAAFLGANAFIGLSMGLAAEQSFMAASKWRVYP